MNALINIIDAKMAKHDLFWYKCLRTSGNCLFWPYNYDIDVQNISLNYGTAQL